MTMTSMSERLLHILKDFPDGMTADELVDHLRSHGETLKSTGKLTGPLSNLHTEKEVFTVRGSTRNGKVVYFHSCFLSAYKPMDVVFKRKKFNPYKACLDLYHDYAVTGNQHSLELAERAYKELP